MFIFFFIFCYASWFQAKAYLAYIEARNPHSHLLHATTTMLTPDTSHRDHVWVVCVNEGTFMTCGVNSMASTNCMRVWWLCKNPSVELPGIERGTSVVIVILLLYYIIIIFFRIHVTFHLIIQLFSLFNLFYFFICILTLLLLVVYLKLLSFFCSTL